MPSAPLPKGEIEQVILHISNDMNNVQMGMHEVTSDGFDEIDVMGVRHYLACLAKDAFDIFFMVVPSDTTHPVYHDLIRLASHMILSMDGRTLFILNNFQNEAITQSLYALFTESVEQYQDTLSMARLFDCACDNNH